MEALQEPKVFESVLGGLGLVLGEIKGAILLPGRATPARGVDDDMTIIGLDDLRELTAIATSPRDLWSRIKSRETNATLPIREYSAEVAGWTLECDGVDGAAIPAWVRAR